MANVKTNRRHNLISSLLLGFATILSVLCTTPSIYPYASDLPVKEEEAPPNAIYGEVIMQALREKGCEYSIQLDFYPEFDGGVHRTFVLSKNNEFTLGEELIEGTYRVSASILANIDINKLGIRATATSNITVKKNAEEIPVVVALEGTTSFVSEYKWLTSYKDEWGNYLSGTTTKDAAEKLFDDTISMQEDVSNKETEDDMNEEGMGQEMKPVEDLIEEDVQKKKRTIIMIIAGVVAILAVAAIIYKKRRQ